MAPEAGGRELPTGTLTFLFTDLEGSTRMLDDLGADVYARVLEDMRARLRHACAEHQGVEFGTGGDAVFVAFPRAADAVAAAVDTQRALHEKPFAGDAPVRVRMGLHSGDAAVVDGDYVGLALHVAARVCTAANGGQVLLTDTTVQLAGRPDCVDLGEHRLRDVPEPLRLHQAVAEGLPADFPPPRTLTAMPNNLPAPVDELVGRGAEILDVAEMLRDHRLVTLTGAGGVGKTRLALEVARAVLPGRPGGAWFVELASVDGGQVLAATAAVLRVNERPGTPLLDTLVERIGDHPLLVVLDNCEHLVDATAELVDHLLRRCPALHVVATSRELLGVRGERAVRVAPLPVEPAEGGAVELFASRARLATPGFDADVTAPDLLVEVCQRLDGLPLAIELAAARLRTLSLAQLAERLDDRFRLLTGGSRGDLARQRTLEAVVAWSYDLLTEPEQALFRRLAVFPGSFDLEAAEAVGSGDGVPAIDVLDLLGHLVEKSLVATIEGRGAYRYQLLETLRQYGRDRLVELGEAAPARERLLEWAVTRADRIAAVLRTPEQDAALAAIGPDHANVRAAVDWALETDQHEAAVAVVAMVPAMLTKERRDLLDRLLTDAPALDERWRGHALAAVSNLAWEQNDFQGAISAAAEAARILDAQGEQRLAAWGRFFETSGHWGVGDLERAATALEHSLATFRQLDDQFGLAYALWAAAMLTDDPERADRDGAEAERRFRQLGSPMGLAHALEGRALSRLRAADAAGAAPKACEALELFAGAGNWGCAAHALQAAAACIALGGDCSEAAVLHTAAEAARRVVGHGHRPWERVALDILDSALTDDRDWSRRAGPRLSIEDAAGRGVASLRAMFLEQADGEPSAV